MLIIDSLAYKSRFRSVHPGKKIAITVFLLILVIIRQHIALSLGVTLLMGAASVWGGGTPLRIYLRLLKIPLIFIGFSLIAIIINISVDSANGITVSLSQAGFLQGVRLAVSAFGAVSCMYFLALSTPLTDIFYVLEKIKCPFLIIELMMLIYRFIFLLWSIARELNQAADSRLGNANFRTSLLTSGPIFTTLFIRALRRSAALYDAMESRGYNGRIQVLPGFGMKSVKRSNGD